LDPKVALDKYPLYFVGTVGILLVWKSQKAEREKNGFRPTSKKALCFTKHWMNEDFTWHYGLEICKGFFFQ
jgi:hypothetical protein